MGASNAGNKSDDKGGGLSYSDQLKKQQEKDRIKNAKTTDKFGYPKEKNFVQKIADNSPLINVVKNIAKRGNKFNQDFYKNKVKPAGKTNLGYKDYLAARGAGTIDAYGNKIQQGDGGNNTPTVIKKNIGGNTIQTTAPTEAEVSQSEAANADAAALKVKKRGRSASILTGSKGVTKTSSDYTLGVKNLLGRV